MNNELNPLRSLALFLVFIFSVNHVQAQTCDGADGIFPPLSGNTVIANGDICANSAVIPYRWNITYTNVDDNGMPGLVEFFIDWDDGSTQTVTLGVGDNFLQNTGPNAYGATVTHMFPAGGANVMCEYIPTVSLQVSGMLCPSSAQTPAPVVRWNTDDENPGNLELSEQTTSVVVYEICAGDTQTIHFVDRSEFNCVPANFPGFPQNTRTRWFQFDYGTPINSITGMGITINTNTGSNPEGLGNILLTTGNSFASQVIEVPDPPPVTGPSQFSFDITVAADAAVNDEFHITLNNWNRCNQYEIAGVPTGIPPVQTTAIIRIIDSPPPPSDPSGQFCQFGPVNLSSTGGGGVITWYSDAGLSNVIHTGPNMDALADPPPLYRVDNTTPGFTMYYTTETLGVNNCEGPATPITVEIVELPTAANAGGDQTDCLPTATLNGNVPAVGTGLWSVVSGPGNIVAGDETLPNANVENLTSAMPTVFRWTTTNGPCIDFDDVQITRDPPPTVANAGPDISLCVAAIVTMAANAPVTGIGTWSKVNPLDPGVFTDVNDPATTVTGLVGGDTPTYRWTITSGTCGSTFDDVQVFNFLDPPADAGPDVDVCTANAFLDAGIPPVGGGVWVITAPAVTTEVFVDDTDPKTEITGLIAGTTYTIEWTVTNGACVDTDVMSLIRSLPPTLANAGPDDAVCSDSYILNANVPASGVGTWTGPVGVTFSDVNDRNATASNLNLGPNTLTWTIANSCGLNADDVIITNDNPATSDAGLDQDACGASTNLAGNNPGADTGTWSLIVDDGFGSIAMPNNENSSFSGTFGFLYTLQWEIDNGTCTTSDLVDVRLNQQPASDAGLGGDECDLDFVLNAVPSAGIGTWTKQSGPGIISFTSGTANDFDATIAVDMYGTYEFLWTEDNNGCTDSDFITVNFYEQPVADAGAGGSECDLDFVLNAVPSTGIGTWTLQSGPGTISFTSGTANDFDATIAVTLPGQYEFLWTENNNGCVDSDFVTVDFFLQPVADAGIGGNECDLDFVLGAVPSVGVGTWTKQSGTGNISFTSGTANDFDATIAVDQYGTYEFLWTEDNSGCMDSDFITVNFYEQPIADAGVGGTYCNNNVILGATPSVGTGTWTYLPFDGSGSFSNANDPNALFSGDYAKLYTLTWTEVNGICSDNDNIAIQFDEDPTPSDAGSDQSVCSISTNLAGNLPVVGVGQWTLISNPDGNGMITDPLDNNSTFSGTQGFTYILRWTIDNGVCAPSFDEVEIEFAAALPLFFISGDVEACVGDVKTFTIPGGNPANYNYIWDISGLPPSTVVGVGSGTPFQFITLEFFDPIVGGNLSVVTEDKVSLCTSSPVNHPLTIYQTPIMSLTSSDGDLTICAGESVTFTATDALGIATEFEFKLNGSTVQSGPSNVYTTTLLPTINSVTVTGTAPGGICPGLSAPPLSHVVNPIPNAFNITGGGSYCATGTGVTIGLDGSEPGITYELYLDGNPTGVIDVPGGGAFLFPDQTAAGNYTILASTINNCILFMNGSTDIVVDPLPLPFDVIGGGTYCQGDPGVSVGLSGSEVGIEYQLLRNGVPFGIMLPGDGFALDFGLQNSIGTYEVLATNSTTSCILAMNLSADVLTAPLPNDASSNDAPEICSGESTSIELDADIAGSTFIYTVVVSDPSLSGASDEAVPQPQGTVITQTLINSSISVQTATYTVIPIGPAPTLCPGSPEIYEVDVHPLPDISMSGSTTICVGESAPITFQSVGQVPFTIQYSDGTQFFTLSNVAATHIESVSPDITTDYEIVSVVDGNGCETTNPGISVSVQVEQVRAEFHTDQNLQECGPYEVVFVNDIILPGVTYEWSWGDGSENTISNESAVSHTFNNGSTIASAFYNVTLFATNDALGCTVSNDLTIEIFPMIDIDIDTDVEDGCSPVSVTFDNSSLGVLDHRWFYRLEGSTEEEDVRTTPFVTYVLSNQTTSTQFYEIVYQASNAYCTREVVTPITVLPELDGSFDVSQNPVEVITTPHVSITNTTLNKTAWNHEWNWGDGKTSTEVDPGSHTYTNKFGAPVYGTFEIVQNITFEDENGKCEDRTSEVFNVVPVFPTVDFEAEVLEGCRPLEVAFTNLSTAIDESTVLWEVLSETGEVVATSTAYEPVITFYDAGIYTVQLSAGNDIGIAETEVKEMYITVHEIPIAFFQVRPEKVFLPDGVVYTQNKSSHDADEFFWIFNMLDYFDNEGAEKDLTSTLYEPQVLYSVKGYKDIMLVVTNSSTGCSDTSVVEKAVFVDEGGNARIPNAFTPNKYGPGAGIGAGSGGAGGFNEAFLPVIQGLSDEPGSFRMTIYDRWGNLLFESWDEDVGWDGYNENGKLLPLGVYVYKLELRFQDSTTGIRIGDVTLIR